LKHYTTVSGFLFRIDIAIQQRLRLSSHKEESPDSSYGMELIIPACPDYLGAMLGF